MQISSTHHASQCDGHIPELTREDISRYITAIRDGVRNEQTVRAYEKSLKDLLDFVGDPGRIDENTMDSWKASLKKQGYSDSTINVRVTAANNLLRYYGYGEFSASHEKYAPAEPLPEPTREEYLRFLSKIQKRSERGYLLAKVFALTGISPGSLNEVTVEACDAGYVVIQGGGQRMLPSALCAGLRAYAQKKKITSGPVFATRGGRVLDRSNVTNQLRRLASDAGENPDDFSPSALGRLYSATEDDIWSKLQPAFNSIYEDMVNTEEKFIAP